MDEFPQRAARSRTAQSRTASGGLGVVDCDDGRRLQGLGRRESSKIDDDFENQGDRD